MPADRADGPGTLRGLLDHIEASTAALERPSLEEFQQLWGRIRNDSQVRRSMATVPEGAGPLHSSTLLHRAMTLMRETWSTSSPTPMRCRGWSSCRTGTCRTGIPQSHAPASAARKPGRLSRATRCRRAILPAPPPFRPR